MAAALPFLSIAGTAMSVIGTLSQSRAQSQAAGYNAQISERNAQIALDQGAAELKQTKHANALRLGSIRAGYGASGISSSEGSPLDVLESSVMQAALEEQNVMYNANLRAQGYEDNASLSRTQAKNTMKGGMFAAAGQALMGGAKAYDMYSSKAPGAGTPIPFYGVGNGAAPY